MLSLSCIFGLPVVETPLWGKLCCQWLSLLKGRESVLYACSVLVQAAVEGSWGHATPVGMHAAGHSETNHAGFFRRRAGRTPPSRCHFRMNLGVEVRTPSPLPAAASLRSRGYDGFIRTVNRLSCQSNAQKQHGVILAISVLACKSLQIKLLDNLET